MGSVLTNNKRAIILWLISGYLLWQLGNDIFALIPEFNIERFWTSYRSLAFIGYAALAGLVWIWVALNIVGVISIDLPAKLTQFSSAVGDISKMQQWLRWIGGFAVALIPTWVLLFSSFGLEPIGDYLRFAILLTAAGIVSFITVSTHHDTKWGNRIFFSVLLVSGVYFAGSYLNQVSPYPFSIGWSEGNRLWDYSTWLGADRYLLADKEEPFAFISPGKLWISGIPFIIPGIDIVGVRLWDTLMKIFPVLILGYLSVGKKDQLSNFQIGRILFSLWVFLFLLQGPIQYSLVIAAVITILGVRQKHWVTASRFGQK